MLLQSVENHISRPGQLARLKLPLELHKEIIDILYEEPSALVDSKYEVHQGLETLCTLSFVCKEWHLLAVRHIFRHIRLKDKWRQYWTEVFNGGTGRLQFLLSLIQANPNIGRSVQLVTLECSVFHHPDEHALMEQICALITPITSLMIHFHHMIPVMRLQNHPRLLAAFQSVAHTPELRELVVSGGSLHTSLLANIPNLKCIDLEKAPPELIVDSTPPHLERPKKLVVGNHQQLFISQLIQEPDLREIFSEIEELGTIFTLPTEFRWGEVLNLGRLTNLRLRCNMRWKEGGAYPV